MSVRVGPSGLVQTGSPDVVQLMHMRVDLNTHTFRNPAAKGAAKYRPTRFSPVPSSLTPGIPSAILGGSWRQRAKVAAIAGVVGSLTAVAHCDLGYGTFACGLLGRGGVAQLGER